MDADQFEKALQSINENVNDDDKELFVAIAALVISIVALLASLLQVAQQYYASAAGYSNCNERAIGAWSIATSRILKPYEFRFEVRFEAPVIFLCGPENTRGPVKRQPIFFIDGSPKSLADTRVELVQGTPSDKEAKENAKQAVHTADNERASWVTLLTALQKMERDSRLWQKKQHEEWVAQKPPQKNNAYITVEDIDAVTKKYSLAVAVQRKPRSWDAMPTEVKKPYATTTWCHVVETLALLGIYWVEFDRKDDKYRGEGNGYTVTGAKVSDLGIMFTFQVHGENRFGSNRVIPVDEVKELCFGFVPTIYKSETDHRRLKVPSDESRDLSILNFASKREIAETLVKIGCNTNTVNYFSDKSVARVSHLFPIAFEIMGMLGRTLHIEKSAFRRLPNPAAYRWDTKNFSLPYLFLAYDHQLRRRYGGPNKNPSDVIKTISGHIKKLRGPIKELDPLAESSNFLSLPVMDDLHHALDQLDEILTLKRKVSKAQEPNGKDRPELNKAQTGLSLSTQMIQDTLGPASGPVHEGEHEKQRRTDVREVLRVHIQKVLFHLNNVVDKPPQHDTSSVPSTGGVTRFEAIDAASPEEKQHKLMELYFHLVYFSPEKAAAKPQGEATKKQSDEPTEIGIIRRSTALSAQTFISDSEEVDGTEREEPAEIADGRPIDLVDPNLKVDHDDIWCTLVFRMICWLMLHDFHKQDVQVPKSELFGSRLPIYIA